MRTICGMSLRGVAYFGASVHICMGVLFFGFLLERLIDHVYVKSQSVESLNIDKENVIYFGLFLPLGILIFKSIDKENKTLLKWATAVFLALQLFGVIIRLKYGLVYSTGVLIKYSSLMSQYSQHPQKESEIKIETYKILALELILTLSYFVSLCIYERQLESFPGRIYTHGGNAMIPLYSTNSSTYFLPSDHHHHSGHHGNRLLSSGSPFFEPPPPYSSVNNLTGITITTGDGHQNGQGQFHQYHHPSGQIPSALPLPPLQQPCSSRSVFANIGRIRAFGSKNKSSPSSVGSSSHQHHHHQSNHHLGPVTTQHQHQSQPTATQQVTGGVNTTTSGTTTTLVVVTAQQNHHHNSSIDNQISNESDSPNAALLENHRRTSQDSSHRNNNTTTTGGVGGCGGGFQLLSSSRRSIKDLD